MTQEALKLALEALKDLLDQTESPPDKNCSCHIAPPCSDCIDYSGVRYAIEQANKTITAIKEALAQPEEAQSALSLFQSGFIDGREKGLKEALAQPEQEPVKIIQYNCTCGRTMKFESVHGVVAPQRTWVGLTDEERSQLVTLHHGWNEYGQAIEAKLKERNGQTL